MPLNATEPFYEDINSIWYMVIIDIANDNSLIQLIQHRGTPKTIPPGQSFKSYPH